MSQVDRNRRWRQRHPERARRIHTAATIAWRATHPFFVKAQRAAWHAKRKGREGVASSVFLRLFFLPCVGCGKTPAMGVDHILPFARGGRNIIENLQPMCFQCNTWKGASVNG